MGKERTIYGLLQWTNAKLLVTPPEVPANHLLYTVKKRRRIIYNLETKFLRELEWPNLTELREKCAQYLGNSSITLTDV